MFFKYYLINKSVWIEPWLSEPNGGWHEKAQTNSKVIVYAVSIQAFALKFDMKLKVKQQLKY